MVSKMSLRRLIALTGIAGVIVACAPAAGAAANTWAGVWNSDFGRLTLDAGGSGSYAGFNPGTVSGNVVGNVNQGTWNQPGDPPKKGTFKFTLSPSGNSFTGEWAYDSGGCGSACGWNGTCIEGPCLKNGTATGCVASARRAAQPADDCPTPTPAAPGVTVVPPPAAFDKPVTVPAPAPGDAAVNTSPPLGKAKKVTVTESGLSPEDATVLAGVKHLCYADFVRALSNFEKVLRKDAFRDQFSSFVWEEKANVDVPEALSNLAFCLAFVDALAAELSTQSASVPHAGAVASGRRCGNLAVKFKGRGRKTKIKRLHGRAAKLRVRCKNIAGGLAVTYSTRSGKPLRTVVGRRLRIAVLRSKRDAPGGQLSFTYHKG